MTLAAPAATALAPAATADLVLPPKISVENLVVSFSGTAVLHGVSLAIPNRSVTALIGPSGCGKSTFLRALNRLHDLTHTARVSGGITLDGQDVYARGIDVTLLRRRVGMVFQRSNPFPMSIFENIAYGLRIHGLAGNRRQLAEQVELTLLRANLWDQVKDRLGASAFSLSGGQQQRLCIARALALDPDVLLMDEPCSALDPASTGKIEELVEELRERHAIVIVTHNLGQAARVSQRTAFFMHGRIVEQGVTADIFERPLHKETEDYVTGRFG